MELQHKFELVHDRSVLVCHPQKWRERHHVCISADSLFFGVWFRSSAPAVFTLGEPCSSHTITHSSLTLSISHTHTHSSWLPRVPQQKNVWKTHFELRNWLLNANFRLERGNSCVSSPLLVVYLIMLPFCKQKIYSDTLFLWPSALINICLYMLYYIFHTKNP